jgi:hypothetical protein
VGAPLAVSAQGRWVCASPNVTDGRKEARYMYIGIGTLLVILILVILFA